MYLYNQKGSNIEVYSFEPNKEKIYEFKKRHMEDLPKEKRILLAQTNFHKPLMKKNHELNNYQLNNGYTDYFANKPYYLYHSLTKYQLDDDEKTRQEQVLDSYYHQTNGYECYIVPNSQEFSYSPLTIQCPITNPTFLLPMSKYSQINGKYVIENVLNLPEILYLLGKFLNEQYDNLDESIIEEFTKLYTFSGSKPIDIFSTEMIKKLSNYNIVEENSKLNKKIEGSSKILKVLKK